MPLGILAIIAAIPIALVLVLMVGLRWPSTKAMPLAWLVAGLLGMVIWKMSPGFILASTLREVTELRKRKEINPFVIFIDEAHLFVPQDEDSPCKQIIRESVRIGRHHGICTVLITQSPMDIDKKAIRQCNTRLLFAIEVDQLQSIQGVKADATQEMIDRLPKAPVGSCILTGTYETIKHAIPVQIRLTENPEADAGKAPDIFSEVVRK